MGNKFFFGNSLTISIPQPRMWPRSMITWSYRHGRQGPCINFHKLLQVFLASVFAHWFSFARSRNTNSIYAQLPPSGFPCQRKQMGIRCSGHSCGRSSNQAIFSPIQLRTKRFRWRYVSDLVTLLATSPVQENRTLLS